MKQLFFVFSFLLVGSLSVSAQKSCASSSASSCSKSSSAACCASKAKASTSTASVDNVIVEADALIATSNGAYTKRTCEISGATSYYEKAVCSTTGKVSWNEVYFDNEKKSFTRVASASMEKNDAGAPVKSCAGSKQGKACCKKDGAAACSSKKTGA